MANTGKPVSVKKQETAALKLAILDIINEEKNTLFSKYDPSITHDMKIKSWQKVFNGAKDIGMVSDNRDWEFVRDKMFGVWKSRALKKKDNARTTGTALDEVDQKIIDIIGKDSPLNDGLPGGGGNDNSAIPYSVYKVEPGISIGDVLSIQLTGGENEPHPGPSRRVDEDEKATPRAISRGRIWKKKSQKVADKRWLTTKPLPEKEQLTIELLKVEIHLRKLQALKIERELGLSVSTITQSLAEGQLKVKTEVEQT